MHKNEKRTCIWDVHLVQNRFFFLSLNTQISDGPRRRLDRVKGPWKPVPLSLLFGFGVCYGLRFLFRSQFLVWGKNKIGFSDLLFDAVWCFSGFSSENMRLNDLNHVHLFSNFACGFRFSIVSCTVLRFLIHSKAPSFLLPFCRKRTYYMLHDLVKWF